MTILIALVLLSYFQFFLVLLSVLRKKALNLHWKTFFKNIAKKYRKHEIVYNLWRIPGQSIVSNICGHYSTVIFSSAFIFVLVTRLLEI